MMGLILILVSASTFRVASITIEGNDYFQDKEIRRVMLTQTPSLFHRGEFVMEIFKGDSIAITNLYNYEGFLETEVDYQLSFDSTQQVVDIQLVIREGEQTVVGDIRYNGNVLFANDFLRQKMTMTPGEPFDKRKIEVDNYIITSLYDDIGYADVVVTSDYTLTEHRANIVHTVDEGEKQFIEKVELIGLERSREHVVRSEIDLKPNDTFRYAAILKSQRRLYNLGIFSSIRIQTQRGTEPHLKIVQFILTERPPVVANFRIGYGTIDLLRLGVGLTHINILGRAWRGQLNGKVSFAEYRANAQLTFPRFFMFPIKYSIGSFYQWKKEIGYQTRSIGGYNEVYINLFGGRFATRYDVENIRTYLVAGDSTENDWLHGVKIGWMLDRRDDPFLTRTGSYLNLTMETSGIIIPANVNYVRPTLEYRLFKPLLFMVAASAFKIGLVQEVSPSIVVPVYKRFYCGGASSVRGYTERSIGPVDEDNNPLGGKILFEVSGELRFPIYRILGGALFIDAGNIWQDYDEIDGALRWGIGAGLRLNTLLGSIRLDYGVKLDRREEESFGVFHFAVGEAF
jgi:outer membrane protein assembly complex protein YaeT